MLDLLPAPDHLAAYRLAGTLTGDDLDRIIADIEGRLERHERIGIFADLTEFDDWTWEAGLKDLRYGLGKAWQLRRFPREAVVTDKGWIRNLVRLANPLVPFVEIRVFAPEERSEALAWAADIAGGKKDQATGKSGKSEREDI